MQLKKGLLHSEETKAQVKFSASPANGRTGSKPEIAELCLLSAFRTVSV